MTNDNIDKKLDKLIALVEELVHHTGRPLPYSSIDGYHFDPTLTEGNDELPSNPRHLDKPAPEVREMCIKPAFVLKCYTGTEEHTFIGPDTRTDEERAREAGEAFVDEAVKYEKSKGYRFGKPKSIETKDDIPDISPFVGS